MLSLNPFQGNHNWLSQLSTGKIDTEFLLSCTNKSHNIKLGMCKKNIWTYRKNLPKCHHSNPYRSYFWMLSATKYTIINHFSQLKTLHFLEKGTFCPRNQQTTTKLHCESPGQPRSFKGITTPGDSNLTILCNRQSTNTRNTPNKTNQNTEKLPASTSQQALYLRCIL